MSPSRQDRLNAAAAAQQVSPGVRNIILANQEAALSLPYYSAVRFQSDQTGADPNFVQTITNTARTAFNYARGGILDGAGWKPAGQIATFAETNLDIASQTNKNSNVEIYGLAIGLGPTSDPSLTQLVWENTDVQLAFNSSGVYRLGRLEFWPSAGGLAGMQSSLLRPAPTFQGQALPDGFLTNGTPDARSYYDFGEDPLTWESVGSNGSDSALSIEFTPRRVLTFNQARAQRALVAGGAGTTGTEAWNWPAPNALGTWVQCIVRIVGVATNKRSVNQ